MARARALAAVALAALLLAACAAPADAQAAAPAPGPEYFRLADEAPGDGSVHYTVCTSDFPPMSSCNASSPPATYTGFDIELFRKLGSQAGWTESADKSLPGVTYEFFCMPFSEMIDELYKPGGRCILATAGITISSQREQKGIRFSYPTYRSSLAIMVYAQDGGGTDGFFFFRPFTWQVWLAIVLTVAAIPLVTFFTEFISIEGTFRRRDLVPGLKEAGWRSTWCMLLMEPFQVTAVSSRIVAVLYGFLATVLINTYCANLAAFLTVTQLQTPINGVEDLRGKAVGTIPVYIPRMSKFGIAPSELPFTGVQDAFTDWLPKLRDGVLVATAIDEPVQRYVAADAGCAYKLVGEFAPFDFGLAWRTGSDALMRQQFDQRILVMVEDGTVSQLRDTFINVDRSECESGVNTSSSITFAQVSGLWVILGAGLAAALLWLAGLRFLATRKLRKRHAAAAAAAAAAAKLGPDAEAGGVGLPLANGGPRGSEDHLRRRGGKEYKAGVAFRQTVSIFGAQIGANRREAEAAAEPGSFGAERGASGALPPLAGEDLPTAQLLQAVRALCDRLEAHAEVSYTDDHGRRVVDERIEEVPEATDRSAHTAS